MLQSITIRKIALIEEAAISFHQGVQVLTGETGAGKSIVVDAVNLILGSRSDRGIIRTGCEKATVEAVFDVPGNEKVRRFMAEENIEFDGRTVIVYRELSLSGRNICRVCGVVIPLARLKELSPLLMDIHGQNDQQFLLDPEMHLSFLDATGSGEHILLMERVRRAQEAFMVNHRAYAALVRRNEGREGRIAALEKDIELLNKARLQPGEEEKLREEKKRLTSDSQVWKELKTVETLLGTGEDETVLAAARNAGRLLGRAAAMNPDYGSLAARAESLSLELEELAYEVSKRVSGMEFDPERLEKIDKRLETIARVEHRFGIRSEEADGKLEQLRKEYEELRGLESEISAMAAEHKKLLQAYRSAARELSASRQETAKAFEQRMMAELEDLGMKGTVFRVGFKTPEDGRPLMPTPAGDDRVEFLICPNPGEPLMPLARIASGGELSRIMLAFKALEAAHSGVDSMVFDEIDTGISGRMAQVVAEKMSAIAGSRQVICVTHLPQIAAAADNQYRVSKGVDGDRTRTTVTELSPEERREEIARMISGADGISPESMQYAERLLKAAADGKKR